MLGQRGYTLIEVILFLTISSALIVVALAGFSTRNQTVQFSQSMRDIEATVKSVANDVTDGAFGNISAICADGGAPGLNVSAGTTTIKNCIFMGKFITFGVAGDLNAYRVYTVVGSKALADDSRDISAGGTSRIGGVKPTFVVPHTGAYSVTGADLTSRGNLNFGVTYDTTATASTAATVGFLNGLKEMNYQVVPVTVNKTVVDPASALNDEAKQAQLIEAALYSSTMYQSGSLPTTTAYYGNPAAQYLCFRRADGRQQAQIVIGRKNDKLSVDLEFDKCGA